MNRKVEQGEATRAALVEAARRLFGDRGFAAVGTTEIVRAAGVTRGALYHHFPAKEDLFEAVYEQVEAEIATTLVRTAAEESTPLGRLRRGSLAFLELCLEPEVQRICLIDGPAVLSWETWQEINARYTLRLTSAAIRQAIEAEQVGEQPVEPLAQLLLAATSEAGLQVARSDDPEAAMERYSTTLATLIDSLERH
ncbi:MAG: TetR family transcriptional regulator [Actinomycetota bacterium]|nr:TetR family transcriptional regulator [Actinomycetota bacterium]